MISVVISSCLNQPERLDYLNKTINSIRSNIDNIEILIGFDKYGANIEGAKCYTHDKGLGHSWNWGIQNAKYDYILQLEDDWNLVFSDKCKDKCCVSDYIKHIIETLNQFNGIYKLDFPNLIRDKRWEPGFSKLLSEKFSLYEQIRPDKIANWWADPNIYLFCNHPHIKKRNLHELIGWYLEEISPPYVEVDACKKFFYSNQKVFFSDFDLFVHIGDVSIRESFFHA